MDIDPNTIFTVSNQCRQRLDLGETRIDDEREGFTSPWDKVKPRTIRHVQHVWRLSNKGKGTKKTVNHVSFKAALTKISSSLS